MPQFKVSLDVLFLFRYELWVCLNLVILARELRPLSGGIEVEGKVTNFFEHPPPPPQNLLIVNLINVCYMQILI